MLTKDLTNFQGMCFREICYRVNPRPALIVIRKRSFVICLMVNRRSLVIVNFPVLHVYLYPFLVSGFKCKN